MKFSENWLRTFVNPACDSAALAHVLTMAGLEVEALETAAPPFDRVVVGLVLDVQKHPQADRLNVCRVDVGEGEPLQIVCGASNVAVGLKVPCARVGARLPGGLEIKEAKLRGVESFGMLCSAKELGLAEESAGLMPLPAEAAPGADVRGLLDLDDTLFTLKLTPNRSDCLSLFGVAREVAALTGTPLTPLPTVEVSVRHETRQSVRVEATEACPRYAGRVIRGVDPRAATPDWMVRRLARSGLRAISPVVDVTNYVLLEMGQPLHAFDLAKLSGDIVVRYARAGERITLLNDHTVELTPAMLVIADGNGPQALAGIMGGAASAVSDETRDIFLESAFFAPEVIIGKSRDLGFGSDSSYRFERGVDFGATVEALERATALIIEICGGEAGPVGDVRGTLPTREPVRVRTARVNRLLGVALDAATIADALSRLGFTFRQDGEDFLVTPPTHRFDLSLEADFVEEVARVHGYDNVPAPRPQAGLAMLPAAETRRPAGSLRQLLVDRDYQEIVSFAFVSAEWERDLAANTAPVRLMNPIAAHLDVMRSTLMGGLVDCLRINLNRKHERVRIFELGRCFLGTADNRAVQPMRIGGLAYGGAVAEQWGAAARPVDFYDVKADVEALCWPRTPRFEAAEHPALHPGRSARVWLGERAIGWLGTLHPRWRQQYDLSGEPVLFELDLDALLERDIPAYGEISRLPVVRRDLAVVVDEAVCAGDLLGAMEEARDAFVTEVALFDVYRGKGVDEGKKSLAFRVLMQDTRRTLTDEEVDGAMARLLRVLTSRFDARLRA